MPITAEDRLALAELLSLHGHLVDEGHLDRLGEVFTPDAVYDLAPYGGEPLHGAAAIRDAALALGAANPVAHHVTNIVVTPGADGTAAVRSKGLGVRADGSCGSVTYDDTVIRTPGGWRIARRTVTPRRTPLDGAG